MSVIEKVKAYWNRQPCNVKRSKAPVESEQWYLDTERNKYHVESHIKKFADFAAWKDKKVLEIGCGIGIDACSFAKAGAHVTAVDLTENSLNLAKGRAKFLGLDIKFYLANVEHLWDIVPVEKYDLIYSFGVIHHTPNPGMALKSLGLYMHENSQLKIMVYHKFSWKVLGILVKCGLGSIFNLDRKIAEYSEAQTGCPVTYSYSKRSVKKLLEGYKVIDCQIDHIFPYAIPEYIKHVYKRVWYFRWMPGRLFHWLETKIGWHLCVTAKKDL